MKTVTILLFFISSLYSQNGIEIEYSTDFTRDFLNETQKKDVSISERFSGIEDNIRNMKFTLTYINGISVFTSIPKMKADDENFADKMAAILASENEIYYKDKKSSNIIHNIEFSGSKYNIEINKNENSWELKNESKKIGGYDCLKAISYEKGIEVIAWYCPKLPYAIGPKKYTNLPGIILELRRDDLVYLATKINLNFKGNKKINIPEGKYVSNEEFVEIVVKSME